MPADAQAGGELPVSDFPDLADLRPFELVRNDVTFTIGADGDGRVRYVATADPDFATPDGIGTTTGVADLLRRGLSGDFASPEVAITPESRSVYALRSGWYAVVPPVEQLRSEGASARVEWVFAR